MLFTLGLHLNSFSCEALAPCAGVCGKDECSELADDDFEANDLSDDEHTVILGGEGFSAEELAAAHMRLQSIGVSISPSADLISFRMTRCPV